MPFGDFPAKCEDDLQHQAKQHAHSLRDSGHADFAWNDVVQMPVLCYTLPWNDKMGVPLPLTRKPLARTVPDISSDDDASTPTTQARMTLLTRRPSNAVPVASSPGPPVAQLCRNEKLNKLMQPLDRMGTKFHQNIVLLS